MGLNRFRAQVVSLAVVIATCVIGVGVVVTDVLVGHITSAEADALARTRAEAVAANVELLGGRVALTEGGSEALDSVTWVYADGRLIDGTVPKALATEVAALSTSTREQITRGPQYLLLARPVDVPGHRVAVVVGVDLTAFRTSEHRTLAVTLILGALTVLLVGVIAYIAIRRVLRVVREMAALADEWGDHDLGRRFALGEPRDEFGELARTLDHLLDRVEDALADERRLTDEIAHELRTPLTVLRGEAQLAHMSGEALDPTVVVASVDRLTSSVQTILSAARTRLHGSTSCELRPAVVAAVADRRIAVDVPAGLRVGVADDVVRAVLGPLLDNALRHARSEVRVDAIGDPDGVIVSVLDDGPGFSDDSVESAFEVGASGGPGHGLGLAVVRRIANATGLDVQAVASGRGEVTVRFPAPNTPTQ
ncbi:two-component sensor histidine kinase [Nocardioides baekrokdamisoli]|uniref:histidine kinase n=1 Tax=Nocardioides baekrokdamisoli TaxID=1804624 RepID=A0A3G9IG24_9ACTN|nr:HAMP domain-containing sensor histidine kinase [Nocardioides baekrokdamisoli]BBH17276.1 two-component sensor histidine kinase [Nocardioides baekrokdamisoli]